jgi:hypothetical protein
MRVLCLLSIFRHVTYMNAFASFIDKHQVQLVGASNQKVPNVLANVSITIILYIENRYRRQHFTRDRHSTAISDRRRHRIRHYI